MAKKKTDESVNDSVYKKEQSTNTGINIMAGEIEAFDNDAEWDELQKDYRDMVKGEPIISTASDIVKYPILMSEYRLEGIHKDMNDYIRETYESLPEGFQYLKYHKLLAIEKGISLHEIIWDRSHVWNGKRCVWLADMLPFEAFTVDKFYYNEFTKFIGIRHEREIPEKGNEFINIVEKNNMGITSDINVKDITNKLNIFTYNKEFNDIRGNSVLRPIRLTWMVKQKILKSSATAHQRGTGIPILYTKGEPTSADKAKIEEIGRSIAQDRNAYAALNEDKARIVFESLNGQLPVKDILMYLDGSLFYNTMTQYMVAGIGQNGSRAATREHKSSYEMMASYILQILEDDFQKLTNKIIEHSPFVNYPRNEWTKFSFNAVTDVDKKTMAEWLKILIEAGMLTRGKKDEAWIRELFDMPNNPITVNTQPIQMPTETSKLAKKERKISLEAMQFEKDVFSLTSASEHYEATENKTNTIIEKHFNNFLNDIENQLSKDIKNNINVKSSLLFQFIDELETLYESGHARGVSDLESELRKISNNRSALTKLSIGKVLKKNIERFTRKLFYDTKVAIEVKLESLSTEQLSKKGGIESFIQSFSDGFKGDKNNIKKTIESGYVDGRGEVLKANKSNIDLYFYSSQLDKNLCDNCASFDAQIMTLDELVANGLGFNHPVNPECFGGLSCRCNIIPYKLRS